MFVKLIPNILEKYELNYKKILPLQAGYRNNSYPIVLNDGTKANFILYKSEPGIKARIRRTNSVSDFLSLQKLPVRYMLDQRIIRLKAGQFEKYGSLYSYLPGRTISWEAYGKDHIKLTGMMMSHMHAMLMSAKPVKNKVANEYLVIFKRMQLYFEKQPVQKALRQKLSLQLDSQILDNFELLLCLTKALPNQQVLHMDFVRGNLLFVHALKTDQYKVGNVALSGILDFEKTAFGHPAFDVARTLAFLLVDCRYKTEQKVRKYFLTSGYNKRGRAAFKNISIKYRGQTINLLESLIDLFLLYDFYKFLRHNPYESLEQNHHFVRTRDILIKRNMLKYSK